MDNPLLSTDRSTLKQLFQEPLYLIREEFSEPIIPSKIEESSSAEILFQLKGENTKNIVFMVFSGNKTLSDLDQDLYAKTLAGLKLSQNDVAFCISTELQVNPFDQISLELPHQKVICFGNSSAFNADRLLKPFEVNSTKILACPSLAELAQDQALKVSWWTALKGFING